ncbi:MAG: hypothetical protein U1F57_11235 [bacterium]
MKKLAWVFTLFLIAGVSACKSKLPETLPTTAPESAPAPESQEKKKSIFEKAGKKVDEGIQKTGDKIEQGLKKTGEQIKKRLQ